MAEQATIYPLTTGYDLYQILRGFGKDQPYNVTHRARKQNIMTVKGSLLSFDIIKNSALASFLQRKAYPRKIEDLLSNLEDNDADVKELKRQEAVAQVKRKDIHKAFEVLESLHSRGVGDVLCSYRVRNGVIVRLEYFVFTSRYGHHDIIHDLPELDNNSALRLLFPSDLRDEDIANRCIDVSLMLKKLESKYGSARLLKLETLSKAIAD